VFIVVATGSRTGFITYLFITAIVFISNFKFNRKTVLISLSSLVFSIIAYFTITSLVNPEALSRLTFESIISSNGTGRFDLWDNALHIYNESSVFRKFFGYGAGSIRTVYTSYGFINQVSHNIFIEILLENGIIGLLVYVALIIKILIMASQSSIKELLFILLGMIVISLGASLYAFKPYWNVILIILYFSSPIKHQNRIETKKMLRE
jgi:O-antigen ligase